MSSKVISWANFLTRIGATQDDANALIFGRPLFYTFTSAEASRVYDKFTGVGGVNNLLSDF